MCQEGNLRVAPGAFEVVETVGAIAPARVMFLGTAPLFSFGYDEMRQFAVRSVAAVKALAIPILALTTTVHGAGYGRDSGESLQQLVRGFMEGLDGRDSPAIERIIFVTNSEREERLLSAALADIKSSGLGSPRMVGSAVQDLKPAGVKKHVFVAMPYADEFENVYDFGIYPAVRNCGFICEKVDQSHFTGDILARIKHGLETAAVVIADLTSSRPNVYLEVGYAWGRGTKVIFLARKGEDLHFDVSTHKCLYYGKFSQLAKDLEALLRGLEASGEI